MTKIYSEFETAGCATREGAVEMLRNVVFGDNDGHRRAFKSTGWEMEEHTITLHYEYSIPGRSGGWRATCRAWKDL